MGLFGWLRLWYALLATAASSVPQTADSGSGWLLVHRFDFEERQQGNYEEMPRYWYAMGRPPDTTNTNFLRYPLHEELVNAAGFGAYSRLALDSSQHVSGEESFYLGVDGGSAGAYLEVGALAAIPGSDYQVTAWVRTQGLRRATTRLSAYLIDGQGRRIDDSLTRVELPATPDGGTREWQPLGVRLLGERPQAAWIGLQLEVLQPQADKGRSHQVVYQDVQGGVWFDDVCVWQVPRLTVRTQSAVNMVRWPQRPQLAVQMRHQQVRKLAATLRIYDHRLSLVAGTRRSFDESGATAWHWEPPLERFGWYLAELSLGRQDAPRSGQGDRVFCAFLWLPEVEGLEGPDAGRFQVESGDDAGPEGLRLLPEALAGLGIRATSVCAWRAGTETEKLTQQQAELDGLLQELADRGVQTELDLWPVPAALAQQVADVGAPFFLAGPKEVWSPYMMPLVMRHGQEVRRWRLGATAWSPESPARLQAAERAMRELVPGPRVVLPCEMYQRPDTLPGTAGLEVALGVPVSVVPENLPRYLEDWRAAGRELELLLQVPAADRLTHTRRMQDLVLRMLYAWQADPRVIAVKSPWAMIGCGAEAQLAPDALAGVFGQTAQRLAGRRFTGWLPLGPGLRGMLFDGDRGGMLVAWNETAAPKDATVRMYLGKAPEAIDVWGNRTNLAAVGEGQELTLEATPVFVEGIDVPLALFRSSFGVEPPLVRSMQSPQDKELILTNPWKRSISGSLVIVSPQEWGYQPSYHEFSIAAGQTQRLPVRMSFPTSEIAGDKQLVAKFQFTAERPYALSLSAPLTVGLPDLDFQAQLMLENGPDGREDVLVTQVVTNRSGRALSLYAFASLPQQPLQEKSIQQLLPGQSVVRMFRFEGAADLVRRHPVRVGVRETSGPNGLNKLLSLN